VFAIKVSLSPSLPKLDGEFLGKRSNSMDSLPILELLRRPEIRIAEAHIPREHYWKYPLVRPKGKGKSYGCNISNFPEHVSEVKYPLEKAVKGLKTQFLATLEVNSDARPRVLYKNRNNMKALEIGYTHVRLSFDVTIRKSTNCPLIQYQSSDGNAPTVAVEHIFPATEERTTTAGNNTVFGTIGVSGQQNDRI